MPKKTHGLARGLDSLLPEVDRRRTRNRDWGH